MIHLFTLIILFVLMLLYFRIADKFNIIDKPNERSSHTDVTIRGGGMVFLASIIAVGLIYPHYWIGVVGATAIGIVSFLDDRVTLSSRVRIMVHLISVTILFYFLSIFSIIPLWTIPILYVLVIGVINAYNFMDGINGITGFYSIVVLCGLQYINLYQFHFVEADVIWFPILSCLVFLYFNFRKKAKCFAGDVGSVVMAFWIIMLLMQLIIKTGNFSYILFLAVYGVDAVLTIIHRLYLRQNIFDAHRLHFYQILANDQKIPHLVVSSMYGILQLLIITLIIFSKIGVFALLALILFPLVLTYVVLKGKLMFKSTF